MLSDGLLQVLSPQQLTSLTIGCLDKSYDLATRLANILFSSTLLKLSLLMKAPEIFPTTHYLRTYESFGLDLWNLRLPSSLTSLTLGDDTNHLPLMRLPNWCHLHQLRKLTFVCPTTPAISFLHTCASLPRWDLVLADYICWWRMHMKQMMHGWHGDAYLNLQLCILFNRAATCALLLSISWFCGATCRQDWSILYC